ncbi:MAG: hypothetical protein WHT29_06860 [Bacteroidales bacterium]
MISEISNFIEYLESNSPEVFMENLSLDEGVYIFLEKEGTSLVVKEENILKVNKNTAKNKLYEMFLQRVANTRMLSVNKSFNSTHKIFFTIGTPFGISFSGKSLKLGREKRMQAVEAYFKAAEKYLDKNNSKYVTWFNDFQHFVKNKMFDYLENRGEYAKVSDKFMFYFFLKEPDLEDFVKIHKQYLSERIFTDNSYNIPQSTKNAIPDNNTFGIPSALSGFNSKKPFLEHRTGPNDVNYRVNLNTALNLQKFFDLQQKNKILPNPMPIFVDENELTEKAIKFYKEDTRKGYKEIIEDLLKTKENLQNFYLIYFQAGEKGSRIVDFDFVPVFRYKTDDMPEIQAIFNINSKEKGLLLKNYKINNVFDFQEKVSEKIFNRQLIIKTENAIWMKYFDTIDVKPEYGATEAIVNLLYKYRKAIYDYIYKSKQQAITGIIFDDIMYHSIIDDIRHDSSEYDKTYSIKEKLNLWFSLYNYFNKNQENMASKIPELLEKCKKIANNDNEHLADDKEFAFAAGQIIYFLLNQSVASNKTHALLEPFLQKTSAVQLQNAISNLIGAYKHAIEFGHGRFERLSKEVLAYETEANIKDLQRFILAGYFAEPVIYEKTKTETNN